ncbi:LOW QUALITY PROTEIN: probable protein phosphatase 2C 24 [Primulina eburnea]|uniref:LOW QUALITY PROTEIN: probable protein phosphatase 2C 24 n=1 Tax=Primulina eburnea TaxID=1245227 RepID=UPI003C6BF03A
MAEICCGLVGRENKGSCDTSSRAARRRRMQLQKVRARSSSLVPIETDDDSKRRRLNKGVAKCGLMPEIVSESFLLSGGVTQMRPKFGMASVCGRRRDMEDAVAIHPSFSNLHQSTPQALHYFGVYDGHGCSHVATRCRERFHELVKEELGFAEEELAAAESYCDRKWWKKVMDRSFSRMDKEVIAWNENVVDDVTPNCRCELKCPACDAVGSTAVIAVVAPDEIIVANCGDSRAVLCRNGKAIPLSNDHKPDRPDELNRIQAAGGRVIFWEGARVLGVLAMSRAIGDNYLKPYVTVEPEVTVMKRMEDDECLILASDGLWDVVSNDTACGVVRMCLKNEHRHDQTASNNACADASMLLTKLALARTSADNVSVVAIDIRK